MKIISELINWTGKWNNGLITCTNYNELDNYKILKNSYKITNFIAIS